jgi:hypothetical protein
LLDVSLREVSTLEAVSYSNRATNESFWKSRLHRVPVMDGHSSSHFHIRALFGVGDSPVVPDGDGCVRIDEFNSIDFMIRSKPISEGSRIFLSEAGEHTIESANGFGKAG